MVECPRGALVVMCAVGVVAAAAAEGFQSGILTVVDGMMKGTENLQLMDGVTLVKTSDATPKSLDGNFSTLLLDRLKSFVDTHAVRVNLADSDFEGRGKKRNKNKKMKGGKQYLLPLIIGIKAKMAFLSALVGQTIAAIAGKAIIVSKIALILGIMLFLKKLVTNAPKNIEYSHIKHQKIVLPTEDVDAHRKEPIGIYPGWEKLQSIHDLDASSPQEMAYREQRPIR